MEEELRQIMFKYRRDEINVDGALLRIETLINAPKNTIHNIEYEEIKPCARLRYCSLVRIEGKCLGRDKCHVYKSV